MARTRRQIQDHSARLNPCIWLRGDHPPKPPLYKGGKTGMVRYSVVFRSAQERPFAERKATLL